MPAETTETTGEGQAVREDPPGADVTVTLFMNFGTCKVTAQHTKGSRDYQVKLRAHGGLIDIDVVLYGKPERIEALLGKALTALHDAVARAGR